jgi:hypothetical protein
MPWSRTRYLPNSTPMSYPRTTRSIQICYFHLPHTVRLASCMHKFLNFFPPTKIVRSSNQVSSKPYASNLPQGRHGYGKVSPSSSTCLTASFLLLKNSSCYLLRFKVILRLTVGQSLSLNILNPTNKFRSVFEIHVGPLKKDGASNALSVQLETGFESHKNLLLRVFWDISGI